MTKEEITIPRWFLERIEDTLRIEHNINLDKKTGETCQDRNIKESLNGVRKLLKGEELTGGERLERLQPSLPSNLDKAARYYEEHRGQAFDSDNEECRRAFKAGAEWMAGQGESHETEIVSRVTGNGLLPAVTCLVNKSYKEGDKVVVQIRKK